METLFRPEDHDDGHSNGNETPEQRESRLRLIESFLRLDAHVKRCAAKVKADIDQNPQATKPISHYVDEAAGIGRQNLQKAFKDSYQLTISEYQLQKRMELAAALLQQGRYTQKQIAYKCGYSNVNNFSRAFKKIYNQTPRNYLLSMYQQAVNARDKKDD